MTALAGYWDIDGAGDPATNCRRMLESQAMYGEGSNAQLVGGPIAIGRRIFRLLPEDRFDEGPVSGGAGRFALVADIRLDNRDELARQLGLAPTQCAAISDAAVLMKALEHWGVDAVPRLLGDFAFAFWDGQERQLMLARDFQGQRPLHYHHANRFLAFASMPKGLHALADIPYRPNEAAAANFLALLPEAGPVSFFDDIDRVEPGQIVTIEHGRVQTSDYWTPRRTRLELKDPREYVDAVRAELDAAVARRLRGTTGVVAAHLSAGLDSSAVAATAARLLGPGGGKVVAFTAVPREGFDTATMNDRVGDEGPLAASVAALYLNIEHVRVRSDRQSPVEDLDRYFHVFERPVLNLVNSAWAMRINDRARERGIKVMLTGSMGNLTFSYAGREWLPHLLRSGRWGRLLREAERYAAFTGAPRRRALGIAAAPWLPGFVMRALGRQPRSALAKWVGLTGLSASAFEAQGLLATIAAQGAEFSRPSWENSVALRLRALRGIDPGNYNKGVLGGWKIDCRDPTADRRLVELCLQIPLDQYFADGVPRALARRVLADRLPRAFLDEPRKGYQAADWHEGLSVARAALSEEFDRLARFAPAADLIDVERMKTLLGDWPTGGWERDDVLISYRLALLRSVSAGHFLRKASGAN